MTWNADHDAPIFWRHGLFPWEKSMQIALVSLSNHCHEERNHQGIGNRLIDLGEEMDRRAGEIACRERLGGTLRYNYRDPA